MQLNTLHKRLFKTVSSVLLLASIWLTVSCNKNKLLTSSSDKLAFSQTQVLFDTVFTTIGSTFQYFTVHNYHNQPIKISNINLVGSYTSPYKINVDGVAGTNFSNITIPANDSIFVFVTVTINPNNTNNPIVIEDSLQFVTNGNKQYVDLIAWGQDAYFYRPNVFPTSGPSYSVVPCNSVWTNDKPHVVFGYLVVDSGCTLTMQPGTKVYMHSNGVLYVSSGGTLIVAGQGGSPTNVVTIQGDRLEPAYATQPGQWGEILLSAGSINNKIQWAVIKNGTTGIEADTLGASPNPTLTLSHSIIKSMSQVGLLGQGSYIVGDDDLVADCQYYCVDLSIGGSYSFAQCTFANYWSYGQRQTTTLLVNNWYQDINGAYHARPITKAFFGNCIIYGSLAEELQLDSTHGQTMFNYYFEGCDVETKQSVTNPYHFYSTMLVNEDPLFASPGTDNYNIPANSPVVGTVNDTVGFDPNYIIDLNGTTRPSSPYDLGAYTSQ